MYVPDAFRVDEPEQIARFIAENSFATVITEHEGFPFASHVPLLWDRGVGGGAARGSVGTLIARDNCSLGTPESLGTLLGHFGRANPHWQSAAQQVDGAAALAIFQGGHAYVSPSWYGEPNVVPTWNYVAVHATGKMRLITDEDQLRALLARTVDFYEAARPTPWRIEDQDPGFIEKMSAGIVGFEIAVERLEGKWKLSQNHPVARRQRVIAALEESPRSADREIAEQMRRVLDEDNRDLVWASCR
jgi:transcriptional regulator